MSGVDRDWSSAIDRNRRTVQAYEWYARDYTQLVGPGVSDEGQAALRSLHDAVLPGSTILEVGSGPGRDADFLEALGSRVRRTDATEAFRRIQAERGQHVEPVNVVTDDLGGPYDGFLALCVLIHVDPEQLPRVLEKISRCLRPGGAALVSMREGDGAEESGPWFTALWSRVALEAAYRAAGLQPVWSSFYVSDDQERWLTHLLRAARE